MRSLRRYLGQLPAARRKKSDTVTTCTSISTMLSISYTDSPRRSQEDPHRPPPLPSSTVHHSHNSSSAADPLSPVHPLYTPPPDPPHLALLGADTPPGYPPQPSDPRHKRNGRSRRQSSRIRRISRHMHHVDNGLDYECQRAKKVQQ